MPPKLKYSKEKVIDAAFNAVLKLRLENITARKVAKELNSSVAPIYSYFKSIDDLTSAVIKKAKEMLKEYTLKKYTESHYFNLGLGVLFFARDYGNIYHALFLDSNHFKSLMIEFLKFLDEELIKDSRFTDLPDDARKTLLNNLWIATHGLASLICAGFVEDTTDKALYGRLDELGHGITMHVFDSLGLPFKTIDISDKK